MFKESAPLIEVDHEQRARPVRPPAYGLEYVIEKPVASANVCVWMIVVSCAVIDDGEARIYKRNRRERSGVSRRPEFVERFRDPEIFQTPQRRKGDVVKVVGVTDARCCKRVPDGRQIGRSIGVRQVVSLENPANSIRFITTSRIVPPSGSTVNIDTEVLPSSVQIVRIDY